MIGSRTGPRSDRLQEGQRIRVVIADDTYLVREALEQILKLAEGIEVARACTDRDSLLRAIEEDEPDVVLTDIRMPPTGTDEGIQVARAAARRRIRRSGSWCSASSPIPSTSWRCSSHGSGGRAYLLKERVNDRASLRRAIKAVASGGSVVDSKVSRCSSRRTPTTPTLAAARSHAREREVLAELAQGKSNGAIAESLVLTKRAVEKHINAIFMKLNLAAPDDVSRRVKAALVYLASEDGHSS